MLRIRQLLGIVIATALMFVVLWVIHFVPEALALILVGAL